MPLPCASVIANCAGRSFSWVAAWRGVLAARFPGLPNVGNRRRHFWAPLLVLTGTLFLAGHQAGAAEPEIIGSERYTNQVRQALLLLAARDTNAYAIVTNYVGRIKEGAPSGMWAYLDPPTYEMSDVTAFYSLTWCAGTMAHDSFHSKLYHDYLKTHAGPVPDEVWTGQAAERLCMKHQLAVMRRIGAGAAELDWATREADGSYVSGHETWNDYSKRKW